MLGIFAPAWIAIRNWPLMRQVIVIDCIIALMGGFFLSQTIKRFEAEYLLDRAYFMHQEIFATFITASLELVIAEDVPLLKSFSAQFMGRSSDIISLNIRNEKGRELVKMRRHDMPVRHPAYVLRQDIVFEDEKFGDVEVRWSMEQTYFRVNTHARFIWILISLSIGITVIVIFLFIDWMVLSPVRLLYGKLLFISAQKGIPQKSVNISKELNRLDEAICQMGETMALIKAREKELLATTISRDYMDKIIQGISDALFVVDFHAVIKMANGAACDLLGYERKELEGTHFSGIVAEGGFVENKLLNPSQGSIQNCEIDYVRKDGQKVPMYFSSSIVFDSNHRSRDIVCIAKDITERKRFENELTTLNQELMDNEKVLSQTITDVHKAHADLKKAQMQMLHSEKLASIGQLAAGVAHEINNPLGFISSNMEVLQGYIQGYMKILRVVDDLKKYIAAGDVEKARLTVDGLKGLEEEINLSHIRNDINTLLDDSMRGLQRIHKIVTDLRTFARDEQVELMEMVQIEAVIDSILSIVFNEIKYKADLIKDFADTPLIRCNPQRLGQVFVNLLINASQALDEKGKMYIKTYQQDKYVCVDIIDNGRGILPEYLQRIFDPFFTTKPVGHGVGLGLSISYEIIKKHGGEMKVQSKIGEGTTFTVMLPVIS